MMFENERQRFVEAGLTERQIADLLGFKSILTMRFVKRLVRHYINHELKGKREKNHEDH